MRVPIEPRSLPVIDKDNNTHITRERLAMLSNRFAYKFDDHVDRCFPQTHQHDLIEAHEFCKYIDASQRIAEWSRRAEISACLRNNI